MFSTEWIEVAQNWSTPALDMAFAFFSAVGDVTGVTILLAFVYLWVDRRVGYLLIVAVVATNTLNLALKAFFNFARPPETLHKVSVAHFEPPRNLAFPSGHAQSSGTFWSILVVRFQAWWFWLLAGFMAFMISISRLFLGVHYAGDIVVGLVVGILVAIAALAIQPTLDRAATTLPIVYKIGLAAGAPLLFLLLDQSSLTLFFVGAISGLGVAYFLEPRLIARERATNFVAFAGGLLLFFAVDELFKLISGSPVWYLLRGFVVLLLVALAGPWLGHKWQQWRRE